LAMSQESTRGSAALTEAAARTAEKTMGFMGFDWKGGSR